MLKISQLWIYPIKSCRGILLDKVELDKMGFRHDRRMMLIDENANFITQRTYPKMALIDTKTDGDVLKISANGFSEIVVPLVPKNGKIIESKVWEDFCQAIDFSEEANNWFSAYLETNCRLVYMPESTKRIVDENYNKVNATTSFSDGFPILIATEASLDFLNEKLENKIEMMRFRPNLVISGSNPFEEDTWKLIKIGEIAIQVLKPCSRCVITTINPETAEKGAEPLLTLSRFRKFDNKIKFAQNAIHLNHSGFLSLNEEVEILELHQ